MVYRLRVMDSDVYGNSDTPFFHMSLWAKYITAHMEEANKSGDKNSAYDNLHKFGATDVRNEPFLDFETEEDAMAFVLKFS
jgi:hypothetical protein